MKRHLGPQHGLALLSLLLLAPSGSADAVTVYTGDFFPSVAEVIAATPSDPGLFGDDANVSLTQTFQVDSTFSLKSIVLSYEYDSRASSIPGTIDIEIFEVADVGAANIAAGASLLSETGLLMPVLNPMEEGSIVLDTPLVLPATAGTAGYALQVTNSGNPGFEWRRTGSTAGSVYDFGQAYEDGVEKNDGNRDFVVALTSEAIPEPSSAVLASALLVAGATRRRRV